MLIEITEYYTRESLARECDCTTHTIDRHIKAGVGKLNRATERIPGLGIRINGPLAAKYIAMMKSRAGSR